jgi:type I restriction enzyme S subunit
MSWENQELGELTLYVKRGVSPKYVLENGIPIVNQRCIRENTINFDTARLSSKEKKITDVKFLQIGDTVINSTGVGTLGRTAYVKKLEQPSSADTHVTIVRPDKTKVDSKFLSLYLNSKEDVIENMGKGATGQTELSTKDLSKHEVYYPSSLQTQKRIADILSAYDDLIETNLKRIKLLEQAAQNIYKEWFVNLRFPGHEDAVIDEETGLPEGWCYLDFSNISKFSQGLQVPVNMQYRDKSEGQERFVRIVDFTQGGQEIRYVDCLKSKYQVEKDSIVMIRYGSQTAGKVARGIKGVIANNLFKIEILNKNKMTNNYLYAFLNQDKITETLMGYSSSATMPAISFKKISNLQILCPDFEIQKKFTKLIDSNRSMYFILNETNQKLKAAREILLPRLMNRTIEV